MSSEPSDQAKPAETESTVPPEAPPNDATDTDAGSINEAAEGSEATEGPENETDVEEQAGGRRILIGSQRDPVAYQKRRVRDWKPVADPKPKETAKDAGSDSPVPSPKSKEQVEGSDPNEPSTSTPSGPTQGVVEAPISDAPATADLEAAMSSEPGATRRFPVPNLRNQLSPDLEEEFADALGGESLDDLMAGDQAAGQATLEEESRHTGKVVAVRREDVFVELGSREQGCLSVRQFDQPPEPGASLEVVVQRFNPEEGLYDLTLPNAAVEVDDWEDIEEGMLVEVRVTGHNTGGLECEVNRLRGFIPISQISLFRVEDTAQFVDEKFTCLVTEANPRRRNLVLSRRAVLEREKEEAREKLLASLEPGQIHEGVVRKLVDFGAFVDLGGVDGLLHISQLAWGRVQHPSEVLSEGQTIKVKIEKLDAATGKMSLAYRDMLDNPWDDAERKYPANTVCEGTVTKLMEFGAFVELESGVEGLVHISELSHKRVWRPGDVVSEGEKIEVMILSVDPQAQRMSLSLRQAAGEPEEVEKDDDAEAESLPAPSKKRQGPQLPLQGGLGRSSGGDRFGLKW